VTRRYGDPVRDAVVVRRAAGAPTQFSWRGRWYVVRAVLAHWVEVGAWWRRRTPDGLPARVDEAGRQLWRVEADLAYGGPERRRRSLGVYDLAYDEADRAWTLARAQD